jgi:hypothetical protein
VGAVGAELVELVERVVVEEVVDPLAGGLLPLVVLGLDPVLAAALLRLAASLPGRPSSRRRTSWLSGHLLANPAVTGE